MGDELGDGLLDLSLESRVLSEALSAESAKAAELIVDDIDALEHGLLEGADHHLGEGAEAAFGGDQRAFDTSRVESLLAEKFVTQARAGLERQDVLREAALDHIIEEGTTVEGFVFAAGRWAATFNGIADPASVLIQETEENGGGLLVGGVEHAELLHALVGVRDHVVDLALKIRHGLLDVTKKDGRHGLGKIFATATVGNASIDGMLFEELAFKSTCIMHGAVLVDGLLRAVDNTNPAAAEGKCATFKDVKSVSAFIHDVDLGEDADGAVELGVDGAGSADGGRVGEIGVGGADSEDDGVLGADELNHHIVNLTFDILRLAIDACHDETGKIDAGEAQDILRSHCEENGSGGDTGASSDFVGAALDFGADFEEVSELLVGFVGKLTIVFSAGRSRLKAEDERAASDDTRTTRKEVTTDEGFQYG